MATEFGMLGQSAPGATTLTTAYTVPALKHATIKVVVCNRSGGAEGFRIAVSPNGAGIADAQYIAYDLECPANDSVVSSAITVGSGDLVRVYSAAGNLSFSITGIEEDD